jgi:uncharacterized peroxidase-related enzyme
MARISMISDEEATQDPVVEALYEGARNLVGRVPNATRVRAHLPRFAAWNLALTSGLHRQGGGGTLEGSMKELIVLKTSMLNECDYCRTHNEVLAQETGLSVDQIDAVEGDYQSSELFTPREKAAIRWAEAVTINTAYRDDAAFAELQKHFTEPEILEVTWLSAYFNMSNRLQNSLRVDIEPADEVEWIRRRPTASPDAIVDFVAGFVSVLQDQGATAAPGSVHLTDAPEQEPAGAHQ